MHKIICFSLVMMCNVAFGMDINMNTIAQIESSGNPLAYNERTKATGLYQIAPIGQCGKIISDLKPGLFDHVV